MLVKQEHIDKEIEDLKTKLRQKREITFLSFWKNFLIGNE